MCHHSGLFKYLRKITTWFFFLGIMTIFTYSTQFSEAQSNKHSTYLIVFNNSIQCYLYTAKSNWFKILKGDSIRLINKEVFQEVKILVVIVSAFLKNL